MQPPMKTSKTLFFLLGALLAALLAALLTWWLAGDKQAAAGTSAVGSQLRESLPPDCRPRGRGAPST